MTRVVLALVLLGCQSGVVPAAPVVHEPTPVVVVADAAVPLPLDRDMPKLAERVVAMYRAIVEALAIEDCAAVTQKLDALDATYDEVVTAVAAALRDERRAALRSALAGHDPEYTALAKQVVGSPALAKCAQDAAFATALDRLMRGAT
jgi:hypothetical protein